jgi:sugar phosphate isomerase/epimerase
MLLAYNTNGLAHHNLLDAIDLLAVIGYRGVSITIDHGALNPFDPSLDQRLDQVHAALQKHQLRCVIETGARFLLDPRTKHEPTLVTADPNARCRRVDFLCRAIDIASQLNADCVSIWSGIVRDGAGRAEAFARLSDALIDVLRHAEQRNATVALEPEPGMLIDTLDSYEQLQMTLESRQPLSSRLGLTLDIGHLHCQKEIPISEKIWRSAGHLATVHVEDMRMGVHDHLMFGDGEIDFPPVIAALAQIRYDGLLSVELSRHSHEGPAAAQRAYDFLQPLLAAAGVTNP